MDHNAVASQKMAERYLLNELEPELRDEFEEHYFECPECAADVHAGALFVEESKAVLGAEKTQLEVVRTTDVRSARSTSAAHKGWLAWLRPSLAAPVVALLLVAIGYQSWNYRALERTSRTPQVLASAVVNLNVRGAEPIGVSAAAGKAFGLTLNLPPDRSFSSYQLDLYSKQGQLEWSQSVTATGSDSLWLYVPATDQPPGTLSVHGITAQRTSEDLGRYPIELQNPKQ
jgi:anti-sigma factor RsiW